MKTYLTTFLLFSFFIVTAQSEEKKSNLALSLSAGYAPYKIYYGNVPNDLGVLAMEIGLLYRKNNFRVEAGFRKYDRSKAIYSENLSLRFNGDLSIVQYNSRFYQENQHLNINAGFLGLGYELSIGNKIYVTPCYGFLIYTGHRNIIRLQSPGGEPTRVGYDWDSLGLGIDSYYKVSAGYHLTDRIDLGIRYVNENAISISSYGAFFTVDL